MATYDLTAAANLLAAGGTLQARVKVALIQHAAARYSAATGDELVYIKALSVNPDGLANAAVSLVAALVNCAAYTGSSQDTTPPVPLDSEIVSAVTTIWPVLTL